MSATPKSAAAMLPARLYALPLKSVDQLRRAVSPWVASSILFPPFLQIAVDGRIGRAAFVEQLLQPYYRRLARIEGYGGEVGHFVAEDEGIYNEDISKNKKSQNRSQNKKDRDINNAQISEDNKNEDEDM